MVDITPIVRHYEQCFKQHGCTPKGMDWPNETDLTTRFEVMLELIDESIEKPAVLDLGCGYGALLDQLNENHGLGWLDYSGIDISPMLVEAARDRWPGYDFQCRDILRDRALPESVDYVIMNGVLTEKQSLPADEMTAYAKQLIRAAFEIARRGIAFNVMSTDVDWTRDDLFHWSVEDAESFLRREVTENVRIRDDYGLFEYTVYLWRGSKVLQNGSTEG